MTRLLAALGLALAASAPAAPLPEWARGPTLLHPVTGATWVYHRYGVGDHVGNEHVETVTRVVARDGATLVSLGSIQDGRTQPSGVTLDVSARGLRQGTTSVTGAFLPNVTLVRLPVVVGDEWKVRREHQADVEQRFVCRGFEAVSVPAGRFDAVRVDTTFVWRDGSPPRVDRTWYAPGVGLVRWEDDEGRRKVLKRFERGRG